MTRAPTADDDTIEHAVRHWLENVVIGLNLCPFAARLDRERQVRVRVSRARTAEHLLEDVHAECAALLDAAGIETTLIAVAEMLGKFGDYNDFLDPVDALIARSGWEGVFQVASFHPHYRFEGTEPDDAENLTNRAPWPLLHILREERVEEALAGHPAPDRIPERNIRTVRALSHEERVRRWPFLWPSR